MGCSCVISKSVFSFPKTYSSFVTSLWESTLLLTLMSQLPAMQAGQLLHEALLCLHAVLLACNQTPNMPFMLPWPTPQCLSHARAAFITEMKGNQDHSKHATIACMRRCLTVP